jgi:hypothetical protein
VGVEEAGWWLAIVEFHNLSTPNSLSLSDTRNHSHDLSVPLSNIDQRPMCEDIMQPLLMLTGPEARTNFLYVADFGD